MATRMRGFVVAAVCLLAACATEPSQTSPSGLNGTSAPGATAKPPSPPAGGSLAVAGMSAPTMPQSMAPSAGGMGGGPVSTAGRAGAALPVATGGSAGGDAAGAGGGSAPQTTGGAALPAVTSVTADGPFTPRVEQGVDGGAGWLFRPAELGMGGVKHPVLVWGTGSTSVPQNYMRQLSRIASHGFVVYSPDTPMVDGPRLKQGLDWLFAENERAGGDLNQKLDLSKVAVGGHSLGSLSTFQIVDDKRITTTIHMDGGTFDGMGPEKLHAPAIYICGEDTIAKPNCDADYAITNVPVYYTRIEGLTGIQGHIAAANEGLEIWIAWMRWQLAGEEMRRADFLEATGAFRTPKYDAQVKGW